MRSKGFSLVEAMVALMILSFISGAVVLMTLQVISVTNSSRLKNQATSFAEEILEQVHSYQLSNGWALLSTKGTYNNAPKTRCFSTVSNSAWTEIDPCPSDCAGTLISGTGFYRYVSINTPTVVSPNPAYVTAKAVVTWNDKTCNGPTFCCKAQVDTSFYNY